MFPYGWARVQLSGSPTWVHRGKPSFGEQQGCRLFFKSWTSRLLQLLLRSPELSCSGSPVWLVCGASLPLRGFHTSSSATQALSVYSVQ